MYSIRTIVPPSPPTTLPLDVIVLVKTNILVPEFWSTSTEILSDIRAIAGVTIVSTDEIQDYSEQRRGRFISILNLKVDGFPYMKSGFNRDTIIEIADKVRRVPNVISFKYNPEDIQPI